jgi:hypothetical protein
MSTARSLVLGLVAAAAIAGCGSDETKTVTDTKTVTVTTPTTAPAPDERGAILDAVLAYYAADESGGISRSDLSVAKTDGRFADVLVAGEAHAILKKGGDTWVVVFDGNGIIPPTTVQRFGIPPEYGG